MFTKQGGVVLDGTNAAGDYLDMLCEFALAGGGIPGFPAVPTGLVLARNLQALVNVGTSGSAPTNPPNAGGANVPFTLGAPDFGVLMNAAAAQVGDVLGAFQGPSQGPLVQSGTGGFYSQGPIVSLYGSSNANVRMTLRKLGIGWVLAGVRNGGNAIAIAQALVANVAATGDVWALRGTRAIGTSLGLVTAYPVNTTFLANSNAGAAQVVTVAGAGIGLPSLTPLTIDGGLATQETVTPTAGAQQVLASDTITIAGTPGVNTLSITVGGGSSAFPAVTVSVNVTGSNTATTAAAALVSALNSSAATLGIASFLQIATNSAGVITIAQQPGIPTALANAIPVSVAVSGAGGFTIATANATLTGGAAATFTATFTYAHSINSAVQGLATSGTLMTAPATAGLAMYAPLLCDLNVMA